jgi:hypothetical protein
MSHDVTMVTPHGEQIRLIVDQQTQCPPPGAESLHAATPEEVRAVEAVFAHHNHKESDQVLGLLGLWTSALVLHDVAVETFDPPAGELEEEAGEDEDDDDHPHLPGY